MCTSKDRDHGYQVGLPGPVPALAGLLDNWHQAFLKQLVELGVGWVLLCKQAVPMTPTF